MTKRWIAMFAGPVAAVALVTGCGDSSNGSTDGDGNRTSADASPAVTDGAPTTSPGGGPATETADSLATEEGGTETAGPTQDGDIAISLAGLPIGGQRERGDQVDQCVSVSYLGDSNGNDIPPGVRIRVTGASLSFDDSDEDSGTGVPAELAGSACSSGDTACVPGFTFTAQNDNTDAGRCFVAIRATRPPDDVTEEENVDVVDLILEVAGVVTCPAGDDALCDDFARRVAADDQTIEVEVAVRVDGESSSPSSSPPSSPSSSSPSSSSWSSSSSSSAQSAGGTSAAPN